jgi:hypothetical protein
MIRPRSMDRSQLPGCIHPPGTPVFQGLWTSEHPAPSIDVIINFMLCVLDQRLRGVGRLGRAGHCGVRSVHRGSYERRVV